MFGQKRKLNERLDATQKILTNLQLADISLRAEISTTKNSLEATQETALAELREAIAEIRAEQVHRANELAAKLHMQAQRDNLGIPAPKPTSLDEQVSDLRVALQRNQTEFSRILRALENHLGVRVNYVEEHYECGKAEKK